MLRRDPEGDEAPRVDDERTMWLECVTELPTAM